MARKKKNRIRTKRFILSMNTAKKVGGVFRNPNVLCALLCTVMFFGLISAAHVKIGNSPSAKVRRLSVKYKGNVSIGSTVTRKGKQFLTVNRHIYMNDSSILRKLYSFFRSRPEVQDVYYVKKIFPDTIEVKLVLRDAYVKVGSAYFDRDGCRLPRSFTAIARQKPVPVISGISTPKTLGPGEVWENIYFQETLNALKTVNDKISVNRILVPGSSGGAFSNGIVLQTEEGARIYWGKVFRDGAAQGISPEMKLKNLEQALNVITHNMDKVIYVDVSRKKPVIKYKLEVS